MKLSISRGDTVQVISGSDKGKSGAVLDIKPSTLKLLVQGVAMKTHFDREEGQSVREGYIDYSNVKLTAKKTADKKRATKKKASKKK